MAARSAAVSTEDPAERLGRLRQALHRVEAGFADDSGAPLPLGLPEIDTALGGGFARGALHEISATSESHLAVATGFALALVALAGQGQRGARSEPDGRSWQPARRHVLWIAEDLSRAENGIPYGPGLDQTGIPPEQLITVAVPREHDLLWAMEEGLRCPALGLVIGETRGSAFDQVVARRLSLAAGTGRTLGLILRTAPDGAPSTASTRWIVAAAPRRDSVERERHGVGPPRLAISLVRNRRGRLGAWIVEWNSVEQCFEQCFEQTATHPQPLAGAPADRPHHAQVA